MQWVKDLVLPQLRLRSLLQLGSDPWPGNSICHRAAKTEKEKKKLFRFLVKYGGFNTNLIDLIKCQSPLGANHDGRLSKKRNVYIYMTGIYMYDRVILLYSRNWHNIVNQLYFNKK